MTHGSLLSAAGIRTPALLDYFSFTFTGQLYHSFRELWKDSSLALNSEYLVRWCAQDFFFFLPPYAPAGIRTHVSRVAPTQQDLLKDSRPTELPRCGQMWHVIQNLCIDFLFQKSKKGFICSQDVKKISVVKYFQSWNSCETLQRDIFLKIGAENVGVEMLKIFAEFFSGVESWCFSSSEIIEPERAWASLYEPVRAFASLYKPLEGIVHMWSWRAFSLTETWL